MDELKARYLRQQMELGGEEVVLPQAARRPGGQAAKAATRPGGRAASETVVRSTAPTATTADSSTGSGERDQPLAARPPGRLAASDAPGRLATSRWRDNLPPIPGPGLTIRSPDVGLIGDEFTALATLDATAAMIAGCTRCSLCSGRTHTVPGEGNPTAQLMLVGEGPGATEDQTGRPFVGAAGQLLDKILEAIECPRPTTYIANIVKCRPPQNRKPLPDEMAACLPYLHRQIALVKPAVLVAMGSTAAEGLLGVRKSLSELRNKVHSWNGIPLVVTYHPAALLRNPNWKKPTWDDIRIARQLLGN